MKQRVYVDTSVIGGCEDQPYRRCSLRIFEEFRREFRIAVVSDLTRRELEGAPDSVKTILESLPDQAIENVFLSGEAEALARSYVDEGVVGSANIADAQHIAIASVERVDVLVSWNFRDIVNLERIHGFNAVNLKLGYPILEIRSPREVVNDEEEAGI